MVEETDKNVPLAVVIDLAQTREGLEKPTRVIAWIMHFSGRRVVSQRPGLVESVKRNERNVIRIMLANPFEREARLYAEKGEPIPQQVRDDIARWRREYGRR